MPPVMAAISAYGAAVLVKAEGEAADATVGAARLLLQRVFGVRRAAEAVPEPVAKVAADPASATAVAALRCAIGEALVDPELAAEARALAAARGAVVIAAGERAVAAQQITGIAVTGDNAAIYR